MGTGRFWAPAKEEQKYMGAGVGWPLVLGGVAGVAVAVVMIAAWLPVLGASLTGAEPKVYWYLSRASALVAFVLLWMSMASGLLISNKLARVWPGAFTAFDLHRFTSLLGLGFGTFHALILLGNTYISYNLVQALVPFASAAYRPVWTGLGQLALYLSILVSFTFYIRKQLGNRAWRVIHFLSYGAFAMTLLHGIESGTDSGNVWLGWMYYAAGVSLIILTTYRVALKHLGPAKA